MLKLKCEECQDTRQCESCPGEERKEEKGAYSTFNPDTYQEQYILRGYFF